MDATARYSAPSIIAAALRLTGTVPLVLAVVAGVPQLQHSTVNGLLIIAGGVFAGLLQFAAAEALLLLRDIAASSQRSAAATPSLSPDEFESVLASALRETAPHPGDPSRLQFEPSSSLSPSSGRRIVCSQCGKKIRVPEKSKYKPGDTAKCPSCKERIVV